MRKTLPPFNELLMTVFERCRKADGERYTDREVADGMRANGTSIDYSYFSHLRRGKREPKYRHLKGLVEFFDVPAGIFFHAEDYDKWLTNPVRASEPDLPAQRAPEGVLLRGSEEMSEASRAILGDLVKRVRELERQDRSERGAGD
ncbi:hypothetical protein [Amycolatopsis anabasis]|uniref:hypothetical protein n=1 Tax=Amycolatopsis anabasis TaxID=1840409 RepID=UPI00131D749E|nr:hypothetical protein [Amycolatopsis anabasis]